MLDCNFEEVLLLDLETGLFVLLFSFFFLSEGLWQFKVRSPWSVPYETGRGLFFRIHLLSRVQAQELELVLRVVALLSVALHLKVLITGHVHKLRHFFFLLLF